MKKKIVLIMLLALMLTAFSGCSDDNEPVDYTDKLISPVSREDGSGTRGAFVELLGIEVLDDKGNKVDNITLMAEITNSTSVMMTTIAGNKFSIGYISLGSLNDTVKAVKVDGVYPTLDTVKDGSYKVSRAFNIAVKDDLSREAQDFIDFILSDEGQAVVEEAGYTSKSSTGQYESKGISGKITLAGSSSVTPVIEKLKEAYILINPDVDVDIQQSDSTTGIGAVSEGICDIGLTSRELKASETEQGIKTIVIALDGIAVVVNNKNPIDNMSSECIRDIYSGEIEYWDEVK